MHFSASKFILISGTLFAPIFYSGIYSKNVLKCCLQYIWFEISKIILNISAGTALSKGAIWDELSKHHHHSMKCHICTFWVQIRWKFVDMCYDLTNWPIKVSDFLYSQVYQKQININLINRPFSKIVRKTSFIWRNLIESKFYWFLESEQTLQWITY